MLTPRGQWQRPLALGILDDHSRLCCHLQWYLSETAEDLVHGLSQAIQKRGLPRALLTDNGAAMIADEVTEGLLRLGIVHEKTLPYSPYQNGKQECFWATLEGRLMEMLDGVRGTDAGVPQRSDPGLGRNRVQPPRAPRDRLFAGRALRPGARRAPRRVLPRDALARRVSPGRLQRRQRQSDGTISLEGVRFEIPARYRHFRDVSVRYARWDLSRVDLVDPRSGTILARPCIRWTARPTPTANACSSSPTRAADAGRRGPRVPTSEVPPRNCRRC